MTIKKVMGLVILGATLFGLAMVMGGCGATVHESSAYYYPNWMPDGRIICCKVTSRWSEAIWGRKEEGDTNYITVMNADGSSEQNLFEVGDLVKEITCSPVSGKLGYVDGPHSEIAICNYDGSGLYKVSGVTGVNYFDWSSDATKIAYTASNNLYVINADGTGNTMIVNNSEAVAWRVGEKIVFSFADSASSKIYAINIDSSSKEIIASVGSDPQITVSNKVVYSGYGLQVRQVGIDGSGDALIFDGYQRSTLKLSYDNTKLVGGDLITGGGSWIGGIWVTDISNGNSTRIR
ncbi:MAG: hypothetical protein WC772_06625 [Candidatus Margulisiibacteriota bacterium]|jgi:hypothetical protein